MIPKKTESANDRGELHGGRQEEKDEAKGKLK